MKNAQRPEKIHLGKLIEELKKGKFQIPDFQREFDWDPWDVRDLIQSIFMDYYIGTLLLWEGSKENFKKLSCENLYGYEGNKDPEYIVLDGQQRLTAMYYAFFQPNKKFPERKNPILFFIRLNKLLEQDYDEAFFYYSSTVYYKNLIENKELQYAEHIFSLGVMQEGTWGIDDWIKGYRDYWQEKADNEENESLKNEYNEYVKSAYDLRSIFQDLMNNYQISYIELDKRIEVGKVCDIFTHINSRGVKLDVFDLLNAITRPKDIFLKNMYREATVKLNGFYPNVGMKTYILMVMSILKQNYCSPKYLYYLVPGESKKIKNAEGNIEEIILIEDKETFIDEWNNAVEALKKGLKSLKNPRDFGAISDKFLPYPSIIPALSAIKSYVEHSEHNNKVDIHSKIRKWYWSSVFLQRYSSSVESKSTKDFMDLNKWFIDDDYEPDSVIEFYSEYKKLDLHKEIRNGSAIYKAIFNILILNEARDFETFELPEFNTLDDHHIVPKSWGKENELPHEINTILNRTPISDITNRHIINDKLPNVYLKRMFDNNDEEKVFKVLKTHLISRKAVEILLRDPFTKEDFEEFIGERRNTIIQEIENRFIEDTIELPENLLTINKEIETVELELRKMIISKMELINAQDIKSKIPQHIVNKIKGRIDRERKKNPSLVFQNENESKYWLQFADLQELLDIISNKDNWLIFENFFGTKEKLKSEFDDVANLRNSIRHSRDADKITKMKGEASILWFMQQLKI